MPKPEYTIMWRQIAEEGMFITWLLSKGNQVDVTWEPEFGNSSFRIHAPDCTYHCINENAIDNEAVINELKSRDTTWTVDHDQNYHRQETPRNIYCKPCDLFDMDPDEVHSFMDRGNIFMTGTNCSHIDHKNFIQDYMLGLQHFYFLYGYHYLTVYNDMKAPKNSLLGVYHTGRHNCFEHQWDGVVVEREELYNGCKDILNDDMATYTYDDNYNYIQIHNDYQFAGNWTNNFHSGYTDMMHSTATLIWESRGQFHDVNLYYPSQGQLYKTQDHITEKTLKAILFSKANCFSLLASNGFQTKWLMDNGFWFLNYEFYKTGPEFITYKDMLQSIFDCTQYLKDLKAKYKTNDAVHQFLMDTYGHKLAQNHPRMMQLLHNGPSDHLVTKFKTALHNIHNT